MMEEKERPVININIHGGNNQILPVATKAEQHFHFSGSADAAGREVAAGPWTAVDEARLSVYVSDREKLRGYIAVLAACTTAGEVGEAVVGMCVDEPRVTQELIVKEVFISALLPFLVKVVRGKGIDNLRHNINEAWTAYKRNRQKKGL